MITKFSICKPTPKPVAKKNNPLVSGSKKVNLG
ncbi:Uncharacterised protein [Vibrio cholerae]|nr:Uncharacterised protein [Vibrio cholerae]CSI90280.1 Uncharacterised protein [Vibrio cholerae]